MTLTHMKLNGVSTLVVDDDQFGIDLLTQMLRGFGMDQTRVVNTAQEARSALDSHTFDLCICSSLLSDQSGADFVKWVRRRKPPGRFIPILVLTAYSQMHTVTTVRDAGANMVIKKPVSPRVLYDRIAWAARPARPFIETSSYIGPDRRFKYLGPPDGIGRRETDLSGDLGDALEPNMSQAEIDALVKPTKVVAQ